MNVLKKISFFSFVLLWGCILMGCGNASSFKLETNGFSRSPKLKVVFQEQPIVVWEDIVYQEVGGDSEGLDTLVLASEINQGTSLAGYVQEAINQLKLQWYSLSGEKTKKTEIKGKSASHPAILKTYRVKYQESILEVAQLFLEQGDVVYMLSYASDKSDHTKAFNQQISSLRLTF